MEEKRRQLTKAETQVMKIVWDLPEGEGSVQDILDRYPEPKPAYTTVMTFAKILTEKGFLLARKVGKANRFRPAVAREDYKASVVQDVKDTFFGGSFTSLVSFFAKHERLSDDDIAQLRAMINQI
ncbi:MAG: BlaI/MecI/CopY family transcriptional regulator [Prevotella sp.]|nr:BlaI/MecI/CopY family transcriptional regulator [Prevotella sp.]